MTPRSNPWVECVVFRRRAPIVGQTDRNRCPLDGGRGMEKTGQKRHADNDWHRFHTGPPQADGHRRAGRGVTGHLPSTALRPVAGNHHKSGHQCETGHRSHDDHQNPAGHRYRYCDDRNRGPDQYQSGVQLVTSACLRETGIGRPVTGPPSQSGAGWSQTAQSMVWGVAADREIFGPSPDRARGGRDSTFHRCLLGCQRTVSGPFCDGSRP